MSTQEQSIPSLTSDHFRKLNKDLDAEKIERESLSFWQDSWIRLKKNKLAMVGLYLIIAMIIMAIIGPMISGFSYANTELTKTNLAPSAEHWFGTDDLGRDMFTRTWIGARISLYIGIMAAFIDLIIGVIYGSVMGYLGGKVDNFMNRITEILFAIPYLLVVIIISVVLPPGLNNIILAMVITGWINMSWIVRGQILQLKNEDFVMASKSLGASTNRVLFRHLLPNTLGPIIVTLTFTIPNAIFTEAFLSFLGLGVPAPKASWGTEISDALTGWYLFPWRMLFPAIFLSLTMFAFNVFGDGLRDALDPKMRQ